MLAACTTRTQSTSFHSMVRQHHTPGAFAMSRHMRHGFMSMRHATAVVVK